MQGNALKTIGLRFLFFLSLTLSAAGCLEEKVAILPNTAHVTLQGNNFNQTRDGLLIDGSAPDMYYFKQNDNGTYTVMLSSSWSQSYYEPYVDIFEKKWNAEYVTLELNAKGAITDSLTNAFPVRDFSGWANFQVVSEINSGNYFHGRSEPIIIGENSVTYVTRIIDCCQFNVFTLDFFGNSKQFITYDVPGYGYAPLGIFNTNDGSTIVISRKDVYGGNHSYINYAKFTSNGEPIFNYDLINTGKYYTYYLTEREGEHYFFNHHVGIYDGLVQWTYENIGTFLRDTSENEANFTPRGFSFEIRFGPGKTQKAHRFDPDLYADYVDVPFEVWDISNNRQLMVSFADRSNDGAFELATDRNQSDYLGIYDLDYSIEPFPDITLNSFYAFPFTFVGYYGLADGFTWDPAGLPDASIRVVLPPLKEPGGQLVKLNEQGVSVVNNNLLTPPSPIENIFKIVPYGEGFAVLCNAPQPTPYQAAQLFLLDENFKQTTVFNMADIAPDNDHRLESNGKVVFYTSILNSPGESRLALRISKIENGVRTDKILNEFISFKIESYQITPTQNGGLALLAWVRPDNNTRDLLFIELDENLNLIAR